MNVNSHRRFSSCSAIIFELRFSRSPNRPTPNLINNLIAARHGVSHFCHHLLPFCRRAELYLESENVFEKWKIAPHAIQTVCQFLSNARDTINSRKRHEKLRIILKAFGKAITRKAINNRY